MPCFPYVVIMLNTVDLQLRWAISVWTALRVQRMLSALVYSSPAISGGFRSARTLSYRFCLLVHCRATQSGHSGDGMMG